MAFSLKRLANSLPLSGLFRNLEQDMETVVKVLHPGPLGIIEHKFSAEEIRKATETVKKAVQNWKRNAKVEQHSPFLKDFIDKHILKPIDFHMCNQSPCLVGNEDLIQWHLSRS